MPQSESMGKVSRDARLLFILTWTLADDSGRLRGNSRMLASLLFPYDNDAPELIDGWIQELIKQDCIVVYQIEDSTYIQICKWLNHQKIDKPSHSKIPEFDESSRILANDSGRIKDQGSRIKERIKDKPSAPPDGDLFLGIDLQVVKDFKELRAKKKAPVTKTAIDGIAKEASKAGMSLEDAMRMCCRKGWQGFEASWVKQEDVKQGQFSGLGKAGQVTAANAKRLIEKMGLNNG